MLAHEIDFYRMYKVGPTAMALLTPDLEIIDMNDEFQAYVGRPWRRWPAATSSR
jgi:hypothetical protein